MDDLGLGKQALEGGNRELAISYFARYIQVNPASEEAWLCLGRCVDKPERREYCYRKVLALNPLSSEAREGLTSLGIRLAEEKEVEIAQQDAREKPLRATSIDHPDASPSLPEMPEAVDAEKSIVPAPKRGNLLTSVVFGVMLALVLCGLPVFYLVLSGRWDNYIYSYFVGWPQMPPLVSTYAVTLAPRVPISTPVGSFSDRQAAAQPSIDKAKALMNQFDYSSAIPVWDQVIQLVPELDDPYYQRALSYYFLTKTQRDAQEYSYYLNNTISNTDSAIAIRPGMGDYYALRGLAYADWGNLEELNADREYLYGIALDNARMAYSLGTTDALAEKNIAEDLVYSNHCQEALTEIQNVISKTPTRDTTLYDDLWVQGSALACLGRLDEAIQAMTTSKSDGQEVSEKQFFEAVYLYEAGRTDEAFSLINQSISIAPSYSGDRYYLRALIYYERGQRQLAVQDLDTGAGNTWFHGGLYSYVQGRMGLDLGDVGSQSHAQAVQVLQYSEATLGPEYNVFRERIKKELTALGIEPLSTQVSVNAVTTPFITLTPQPTSRALIPTPLETLSANPATSLPIQLPDQAADAIVVDPESGSGTFTIYGYSTPVFRFQPAQAFQVKSVNSLSMHFASGQFKGEPPFLVELWDPYSGDWNLMGTVWGDNKINQPEKYVLPSGDVFVALRNGSFPISVDDMSISMEVQTQDGQTLELGAK
jgi:Flp pilus assembly protein TadD